MEREHKRLLIAQEVMCDAQANADERIAEAEAKHAGEHDDLQEKLHILYDVADNWIREKRGGKNGAPPAEP